MAETIPSKMRAMQYTTAAGGLEKNLKLNKEASLPKGAKSLPKDSALVKIAYTTLNPFDYKMPEMPVIGTVAISKPAIPCIDFSGTIVASTIPNLKTGDRVFGLSPPPKFGTLSEYIVVNSKELVVPLPDEISLEDASTIGTCGGTAYQTVVPFVKKGGKVLINGGSGGIGTFAIQIAKAIGCTVTATCSGVNVELCKSLGADDVIDYRTSDVVEHLKKQGTQHDLIIDYVGTPNIYWNAQHYLQKDGHFVTVAVNPTFSDMKSLMAIILLPRFLGGGQRKSKFVLLTPKAEQYVQIAKWMQEGKVKTSVEKTFEFEEAVEGFKQLRLGRTKGKLVVRIAGG